MTSHAIRHWSALKLDEALIGVTQTPNVVALEQSKKSPPYLSKLPCGCLMTRSGSDHGSDVDCVPGMWSSWSGIHVGTSESENAGSYFIMRSVGLCLGERWLGTMAKRQY
jgi:hypothetical protein